MLSSMSRKGNCWDNSVSESFFNTIKTELIYNERYTTRDIAKQSIFQYIEGIINRVRRHSLLAAQHQWYLKSTENSRKGVSIKNRAKSSLL